MYVVMSKHAVQTVSLSPLILLLYLLTGVLGSFKQGTYRCVDSLLSLKPSRKQDFKAPYYIEIRNTVYHSVYYLYDKKTIHLTRPISRAT